MIGMIDTIIGIGTGLRKSLSKIQINLRRRFKLGKVVLKGLVINMLQNGWRKIPKS